TSARWAWVEYMLAQCGPEAGMAAMDGWRAGGRFAAWRRAFAARDWTPSLKGRVADGRRHPTQWPRVEPSVPAHAVGWAPRAFEEPPDLLPRPDRHFVAAIPLAVVHVEADGAAVVETVLAHRRAHSRAVVADQQVVPGELSLRHGNRVVVGAVDDDAGDGAGA